MWTLLPSCGPQVQGHGWVLWTCAQFSWRDGAAVFFPVGLCVLDVSVLEALGEYPYDKANFRKNEHLLALNSW
jgi:hypothetical protein